MNCSMLIHFSVTVFTLNVATVVTFATLPPALELLLQRITQVLSVVMISHMFLNLKGSNRRRSKEAESHSTRSGYHTKRSEVYETVVSLDTRVTRPKLMSSLVGNLGNELIHTSILDKWVLDENVSKSYAKLFSLSFLIASHSPPITSNFSHDHAPKQERMETNLLPINRGIRKIPVCYRVHLQ
jgi:hypothetical protein